VTALDQPLILSGHAALTGVWYPVGAAFEEMLVPGCFRRTLSESPDVVLLLGHGDAGAGLPLARTTANTLTLSEDDAGLHFEARLDPDDPDSQMLARKLTRKDLDGQCSFCFIATSQQWDDSFEHRKIIQAGLHKGDVSIVTQGANEKTHAALTGAAARAVRGPVGQRTAYVPDMAARNKLKLMALKARRV
jgi:HK97 family phage prohead protease